MGMKIHEYPPILTSSTQQNVSNIRDYLVRLIRELELAETAAPATGSMQVDGNGRKVIVPAGGGASQKDIDDIRKNAANLRALIIKTSNDLGIEIVNGDTNVRNYADGQIGTVQQRITDTAQSLGLDITNGDSYVMNYTDAQIEGLDAQFKQTYVAHSEFGTLIEDIDRKIVNTARDTVESFGYLELIQSAQNTADAANQLIQNYSTVINGQIRRGIVMDPDTGFYVTGIAISQNLQFTGEVTSGEDGYEYYYLEEGQTFGLYTSTGWQFWIDGFKKGWYNSLDGMLHIANVYIENTLQFGTTAQFIVDGSGRFGLKHIRST